jgi:hypothetical protein
MSLVEPEPVGILGAVNESLRDAQLEAKFKALASVENALIFNIIGLAYTLYVRFRLRNNNHGPWTIILAAVGVISDVSGLALIHAALQGKGPQSFLVDHNSLYAIAFFNIGELLVDLILLYQAVNKITIPTVIATFLPAI